MNTRKFNANCGLYYPLDGDLEGNIEKLKSNLKEMGFSDELIIKTQNAISKCHLELVKEHPDKIYENWPISMIQNYFVKMLMKNDFEINDAYNIINCTPFIQLCCA